MGTSEQCDLGSVLLRKILLRSEKVCNKVKQGKKERKKKKDKYNCSNSNSGQIRGSREKIKILTQKCINL